MTSLDAALTHRLDGLRAAGLYRTLRRLETPAATRIEVGTDGPGTSHQSLGGQTLGGLDEQCARRSLLNFSSNDYLGLAHDPLVKAAAAAAVERWGAGSGASRLVCGSLGIHHELEETLAAFTGAEAAIVFPSGYAAATGTIAALTGPDDVVVLDKRAHACLIDGARLSRAKLRVFRHNDLGQLESILQWADRRASKAGEGGTLVVTESVFSMDGDLAPLPELVALTERHGAWLMVDEAHATGLYGARGSGLAEAGGVANRIGVRMGTLGKALGAEGGFVCGSRVLIDFLVNRARSFIFTTAPGPAMCGAALAAINVVRSERGRRLIEQLWRNVDALGHDPRSLGGGVDGDRDAPSAPESGATRSAILPVIVGDERRAVRVAERLLERGFFVPAIRHPTVPRGEARLRATVSAAHELAEVQRLRLALRELMLEPTS